MRLKLDKIDKSQPEVFSALRAAGIGVNLHYIPVYRQPFYEKLGFKKGYCPEAEIYYSEVINLPMFPAISDENISYVTDSLSRII